MDAPKLRLCLIMLSLLVSTGASYQTPNFIVTAPTAQMARQVGDAAEVYRRDLAEFWLDKPLPKWSRPCRLRVRPGTMGAGGETRFQFVGREVLNWDMYVQGSMERILDSVLPHEVNHTIFACHFRKPLPRWADEGAATLFEHRSEQVKQLHLLNQVIKGGREFITLRKLLTMKEYPKGYRPMLILYAEGYALADFLVQQGGRKRYLKFLADGEKIGWTQAIKANYHHGGVDALQKNWQGWVMAGMPQLKTPAANTVAVESRGGKAGGIRPAILDEYPVASTIRSQSPDADRRATDPAGQARQARPPVPKSHPGVMTAAADNIADSHFTRAASGSEHRGSSFEAPRPRQRSESTRSGSGTRFNIRDTPHPPSPSRPQPRPRTPDHSMDQLFFGIGASAPGRAEAYEPTRLTLQATDRNGRHRKHLPQERNVVSGSIPQWAGFPGQKELF